MELLQYKYHNAYVIQASSTDIGLSWRKFKVRAKQLPPERYCNYVNEDLVEVGYQYSFDRKGDEYEMRSATTGQRPDIVMHIHKNERDITLTYLYDAKYSVRGDDDATLGNVQDEPKPETINAMHHYRDAIYYGKRGEQRFSKEIIGGYILFPGRMDEHRLLEQIQNHNKVEY